MSICTRCIIPDSYPGVIFEDGICSLCTTHDRFPRLQRPALGKDKLLGRLTSKKTGKYHCIVPLSGGKDSSYALYYIVRELGLTPLAVSVDSGLLTDSAKKSVQRICENLGVDLVVHKSRFRRRLAREALHIWKHRGEYFSVCLPCETTNRSVAINEATKRRIPFIIWGASDYEDDASTFLSPGSMTFRQSFAQKAVTTRGRRYQMFKDTLRDMGLGIILPILRQSMPIASKFKALLHALAYLHYSIRNNLEVGVPEGWKKWMPFVQTSFEGKNVETIYLFDYIPYDPNRFIETIKREVGWEAPAGKETRMDCKLHSIVSYYLAKETGITSDGFTYSVLVRYGLMSRQEALERETLVRSSLKEDCERVFAELGIDSQDVLS